MNTSRFDLRLLANSPLAYDLITNLIRVEMNRARWDDIRLDDVQFPSITDGKTLAGQRCLVIDVYLGFNYSNSNGGDSTKWTIKIPNTPEHHLGNVEVINPYDNATDCVHFTEIGAHIEAAEIYAAFEQDDDGDEPLLEVPFPRPVFRENC
jgi:hypothetical protein